MARTTAKLFRKMIGKNDDNEDSGVGPLKSDGTPDLRFKSNREQRTIIIANNGVY